VCDRPPPVSDDPRQAMAEAIAWFPYQTFAWQRIDYTSQTTQTPQRAGFIQPTSRRLALHLNGTRRFSGSQQWALHLAPSAAVPWNIAANNRGELPFDRALPTPSPPRSSIAPDLRREIRGSVNHSGKPWCEAISSRRGFHRLKRDRHVQAREPVSRPAAVFVEKRVAMVCCRW